MVPRKDVVDPPELFTIDVDMVIKVRVGKKDYDAKVVGKGKSVCVWYVCNSYVFYTTTVLIFVLCLILIPMH